MTTRRSRRPAADLYEQLGVPRDADTGDIDAAWVRAGEEPYVAGGRRWVRRVAAAHRVLSDPVRRAAYDRIVDGGVVYATFRQRALASLADGGLLSPVSLAVRAVVVAVVTDLPAALVVANDVAAGVDVPYDIQMAAGRAVSYAFGLWLALMAVSNVTYFGLQEGSARSATFGKRVVKVQVVDAATFERVSRRRAAWRTLAKVFSIGTLGAGYLWMFVDRRRRTFHDLAARTVVIRRTH